MTATQGSSDVNAPPAIPGWVRGALLVVAILETLNALTSLPILLGDRSEIPGPGGWAIIATIGLHPLLAIAALTFCIRGRIDRAVIALAGVVLIGWLRLLPAAVHGTELSGSPVIVLHGLMQMFVFPVLAVAAIVLALRGARLALASIFVGLPTVVDILGVVAFAIGVAIYGF